MVFHVGNMGVLMYSAGWGYINIPACYGYLVQTYQGALMGEQSHLLSSCSLQLSSDYELGSFHICLEMAWVLRGGGGAWRLPRV
jgi:hypothetical protein